MRGLTPQYFCSIVSGFEKLEKKVIWVNNPDFNRLLYVSKSYEDIWGRKSIELYNNFSCWANYLVEDNRELVVQQLKMRVFNQDVMQNRSYYRIFSGGRIKFIKDTCYNLLDNANNVVAVGGISEEITEREWISATVYRKTEDSNNLLLIGDVYQALNKELSLKIGSSEQSRHPGTGSLKNSLEELANRCKLTHREYECFNFIVKGQSAKEIARSIGISPRTVEVFISNLKQKFACRTRLELLSKVAQMTK